MPQFKQNHLLCMHSKEFLRTNHPGQTGTVNCKYVITITNQGRNLINFIYNIPYINQLGGGLI